MLILHLVQFLVSNGDIYHFSNMPNLFNSFKNVTPEFFLFYLFVDEAFIFHFTFHYQKALKNIREESIALFDMESTQCNSLKFDYCG